ncbi:Sodium/calcium exchanger protein-domain-containing protein [Chytriomyces sp. MP71]|nr:Sodium/calcium exchanger protein-domain-containing protein [Chytriomyces sp. MP71]
MATSADTDECAPLLVEEPVDALNNAESFPDLKLVTVWSSLLTLWNAHPLLNCCAIVLVPLAVISAQCAWKQSYVFAVNFAAIIPLAVVLDFSTDQLSMRLGGTVGGLVNASFGNFVELATCFSALHANKFQVVKDDILGSILSNALFILGCCFLMGGTVSPHRDKFQKFSSDKASVNTSLLLLTVMGFLLPLVMRWHLHSMGSFTEEDQAEAVLSLSRSVAVILISSYFGYVFFHLYTNPNGLVFAPVKSNHLGTTQFVRESNFDLIQRPDEDEKPELVVSVAILALGVGSLFTSICAYGLIDSLGGLSQELKVSNTFIAIVVLPLVSNASAFVTAVSAAMRNKLDLSIQIAVGSAHQMSMFVAPTMVIAGWFTNRSLDLDFGLFSTAVALLCVLVANALIQDGRTHWFEGAILLAAYAMVACGFFFQPVST